MKVSIFASFLYPVDSRTLYEELRNYCVNVTDMIDKVYAYGDIFDTEISDVVMLMLKYEAKSITITNPSL
jgi:hypothetical protein